MEVEQEKPEEFAAVDVKPTIGVEEKLQAIHLDAPTDKSGVESFPAVNSAETTDVRSCMLNRVAKSDAHFKHQQRGEPDLSEQEKYEIAADILENKPVTFLARFGRYLTEPDLEYFTPLKDQYEVDFYLADIRRFLDDKKNETKKRNRRFEAMKKMMTEGDYFTAESMKERDPLLYDQLVGQYLSKEEIEKEVEGHDLSLSAVLVEHVQSLANTQLYQQLKDMEESQMEEEENSNADSEEEDEYIDPDDPQEEPQISALEKQMLKNEFLRTMQLRFLNGEDEVDYRNIDENEEFDSLDIREQDEEEKYFDNDDSDENYFEDLKLQTCGKVSNNTCFKDNMLGADNGTLQGKMSSNCLKLNSNSYDAGVMDSSSIQLDGENTLLNDRLQCADEDDVIDYEQYEVTEDVCPGLDQDYRKSQNVVNEYGSDITKDNG